MNNVTEKSKKKKKKKRKYKAMLNKHDTGNINLIEPSSENESLIKLVKRKTGKGSYLSIKQCNTGGYFSHLFLLPSRYQTIYFITMNITYKPIRHGYARIDKDGKLLITIPLSKKGNKTFEDVMIFKAQQLLKRYSKHTHIDPIQKETVLLFGEQVPVEDFFKQYKKKISSENKKTVTKSILKDILKDYATPIFDMYSKKLGISYKSIIFRKTTSKRGSCTHDQKFSLNLDLIHLPTKYIKYVIIHEVCHLKEKNHSKKFRTLVENFCPKYKETKKELRKFVIK